MTNSSQSLSPLDLHNLRKGRDYGERVPCTRCGVYKVRDDTNYPLGRTRRGTPFLGRMCKDCVNYLSGRAAKRRRVEEQWDQLRNEK